MSLALLVREDNWKAFDNAWTELMGNPEQDLSDLHNALGAVAEKRRMPRCLPLLREHANKLLAAEKSEAAAYLLGNALVGGASPGEVFDALYISCKKAWGEQPWWDRHCELAKFQESAKQPRQAWKDFREMLSYDKGRVVFHPAGWGVGEVISVDPESSEIEVQFESGRSDRFPLRTAVDIFQVLALDDLRTQSLRDKEGLKSRLKDEPLAILRAVLNRYNGRATSTTIKSALLQIGVTGSAWTNWWRKTRLQAENDPWFKVTGRGPRVEVTLLEQAVDPTQGLQNQLREAASLQAALNRVRDLMGGAKLEEQVKSGALTVLRELAAEETHGAGERLNTWMLIREETKETPEELTALITERWEIPAPGPMKFPPLWTLFHELPTVRDQERCVGLCEEVMGQEALIAKAAKELVYAPSGMVKPLVDLLMGSGHESDLADLYCSLLARPTRAPFILMLLTKMAESDKLKGKFPTPAQRAQALVELSVHLNEAKRGNSLLTRAHQRLVDLLVRDDPPLLKVLLKGAGKGTMRTLGNMLHRGVDDSIDAVLTDTILDIAPEIIRGGDRHFWDEENTIWSTRHGMNLREEELKELHAVKIPENRDAIERALGFGDLSENAEWEQAIQEQRQLAETAAQLEKELRQVHLIEEAPIPENTASPGTAVTYRETESKEEKRILILGPWDSGTEGAVSYRAPLAQGMLGLGIGDKATIKLPQGQLDIEVLSVEMAELPTT